MKIINLRDLTRKYKDMGYAIAGVYLLAWWLWQRRRTLVPGFALGTGLCLLLCGYCAQHKHGYAPSSQASYTVLDLGTLSGSAHSGAYGINNQEQVVGCCHTNYNQWRAFVWHKGVLQELANLGSGNWAVNINNKGQIVGVSNKQAVLWQNGKVQALNNVPEPSIARAVNDKGQIVGSYHREQEAFLWHKRKVTKLGHLPDRRHAYATGINAKGQVVGASGVHDYSYFHAFLWRNGNMVDLGTLADKQDSQANAINDREVIVGKSGVARNTWHACLWKQNKIVDMGTLPLDPHSEATAINNKDVVVGYAGLLGADAKRHAFVYVSGKMADLNSLIPANAGWVLERADGVNDKGQIVGTGLHNGQRRAFLLTLNSR